MARKTKTIISKKVAGKPPLVSKSRKTTLKCTSTKKTPLRGITYREGVNGVDFQSLRLAKQYKGLFIYKIEFDLTDTDKCVNYVDTANNTVVFRNKNGEYILFNLDGTPLAESIKSLCLQKIMERERTSSTKPRKNDSIAKGIILLQDCRPAIDLSRARATIEKLNAELDAKCHGKRELFIKLAPFYEFNEDVTRFNEVSNLFLGGQFYNTLILALCNRTDSKCISTIELLLTTPGEISMLSKTIPAEEGKRYNKLLRCVLTILAMDIPGVRSIKSVAVNPISAWLLIHYFHARIDKGDPFEDVMKDSGPITQTVLNTYYAMKKGPMHLTIDVTKEQAADGYIQFHKLVARDSVADEVKC